MTPIAPYVLSKRPIVIAPYKEIEISPLICDDSVISIDGQINFNFDPNYTIYIRKADKNLSLLI